MAVKSEFGHSRIHGNNIRGAVSVWTRNWQHVEQHFDLGSAVRKIMYTTKALESVNSSLRIVTRKDAFPNESSLLNLLFLRVKKLEKKWGESSLLNWALVCNQLEIDDYICRHI